MPKGAPQRVVTISAFQRGPLASPLAMVRFVLYLCPPWQSIAPPVTLALWHRSKRTTTIVPKSQMPNAERAKIRNVRLITALQVLQVQGEPDCSSPSYILMLVGR